MSAEVLHAITPLEHPLKEEKRTRICFSYDDPFAEQVAVVGTFNGWNPSATPMLNTGGGGWSAYAVLSPGRYEYRYVVDGHRIHDDHSEETVGNPLGGLNSVLRVPGSKACRTPALCHNGCDRFFWEDN